VVSRLQQRLQKLTHRVAALPSRRVPGSLLRSTRSALRSAFGDTQQRFDPRLREGESAFWRIVPGAHGLAEALQRLHATGGRLPVPVEALPRAMSEFAMAFPGAAEDLIAQAEQSCRGVFVLFEEERLLGVRPDWQLDARSGRRWDQNGASGKLPVTYEDGSDVKWPWELGRLQHLPAVAHAFCLTQKTRYAELVLAQIESFIDDNPYRRGVQWMSPMDAALRAVSMSWAFELCKGEASPSQQAKIYRSLWAHGKFLTSHLEETALVPGNHLLADLLGITWLGCLYPGLSRAGRWRVEGLRRLRRELAVQVLSDGGSFESSTGYQRLVFEMTALAALVARANGEPVSDLAEILRRMGSFTAAVLQPDGRVPQLGDNDAGRAFRYFRRPPNDQRYVPPLAALIAEDASLASSNPFDAEVAILLGPDAADRHAKLAKTGQSRPSVRVLRESGVATYRHGELFTLFAAMPPGQGGLGGHHHNDQLSFLLFDGADLIVDPGTYVYTADPAARNRFRSGRAHAVPELDGSEPETPSGDLFFLPQRGDTRLTAADETADGARFQGTVQLKQGLSIERTIEVRRGPPSVRIEDHVSDRAGGTHTLTVRFPLAPGFRVELGDDHARLSCSRRRSWEVRRVIGPATAFAVEPAEYSETYGSKVGSFVLLLTTTATAPFTFGVELRGVSVP
jgi:hypothetical protein